MMNTNNNFNASIFFFFRFNFHVIFSHVPNFHINNPFGLKSFFDDLDKALYWILKLEKNLAKSLKWVIPGMLQQRRKKTFFRKAHHLVPFIYKNLKKMKKDFFILKRKKFKRRPFFKSRNSFIRNKKSFKIKSNKLLLDFKVSSFYQNNGGLRQFTF